MWHDPDSPKIKTIRVPASLNCRVGMISFMGVPFAGTVEQLELVIVQFEQVTPQFYGELGSPCPMLWISDFVDSA
ncbi:hypothetical protein [Novipirellula sp.]|uniref:hypothetical protein n=1 Tax=Novipirellula sp. TaxID=2795430 RepID=UPI003562D570